MDTQTVLIDLDETIIDDSYRLTVPEIEFTTAIARAQERGLTIGLNSDSSFPTLLAAAKRWGIEGPVLAEQSVICLQDRGDLLIPTHDVAAGFTDVRRAFALEMMERARDGGELVLFGDVNQFARTLPVVGPNRGPQRAILINGMRSFSMSYFARARGADGNWEVTDAVMDDIDKILNAIGGTCQPLWSEVRMERNMRYGITIVHHRDVHKRVPVARLRQMRECGTIYMIGDSMADYLGQKDIVQCAVHNASPEYKKLASIVSAKERAAGVMDILETILR